MFGSAYATLPHPPTPKGIHLNYTLHPNQAESFENPLFWDASVVCYAYTQGEVDFKVTVLKHAGKVNGRKMHSGESAIFTASNGARFEFEADGQAKISVTNLDGVDLEAKCEV